GSRDPFALRRTALGIIRLILENQLRLSLREVFQNAVSHLDPNLVNRQFTPGESLAFVAGRLEVDMRAKGFRHDLINAVYSVLVDGLPEDDLVRLMARVNALANFLGTEDGTNLLVAYRRARNIVAMESGQWKHGEINPSLLREPEEGVLAELLA